MMHNVTTGLMIIELRNTTQPQTTYRISECRVTRTGIQSGRGKGVSVTRGLSA